jgi:hypothetical protein
MAQESVAAVAGELDFMAGFWREGGECCRPQGSVGPASGPDATGARPDLGARDKTESSLPSMLTGAFTTGARSIVCPGRSAVRCALQVSACFCSLQAAIDAKRRAHKHATTQGVPSRCFPGPDKVVSHRRGPTSWDVFRVASLFPSFLCLTNPRCVLVCTDNGGPGWLVPFVYTCHAIFETSFRWLRDHVSVIIFIRQV